MELSMDVIAMIITAVLAVVGAITPVWLKVRQFFKALAEIGDVALALDRALKLLGEITKDKVVTPEEAQQVLQTIENTKVQLEEAKQAINELLKKQG